MSILRQFQRALNVALQQTQSSVFPPGGGGKRCPHLLLQHLGLLEPRHRAAWSQAAGPAALCGGHPAGVRAGRAGEEGRRGAQDLLQEPEAVGDFVQREIGIFPRVNLSSLLPALEAEGMPVSHPQQREHPGAHTLLPPAPT